VRLSQKNGRIIISLFFLALLILGAALFKDYGVHWDEYQNQLFGQRWYDYITDTLSTKALRSPDFLSHQRHDWVHGPVVEVLLYFIHHKLLEATDSRDIIFIRHMCTFLVFCAGVFFFYLLCKRHFKNWAIALLGATFLVVSPRIFSHSFYNSVDIPFLSLYIISMYTLLMLLDKPTLARAMVHALSSALLIGTRAIGIAVVLYTLIFLSLELRRSRGQDKKIKQNLSCLSVYIPVVIIFTVLFWPLFWPNPITQAVKIFAHLEDAIWHRYVLYLGNYIRATGLPWHYAPVWIAISTPIIYTTYFIVGLIGSVILLLKRNSFDWQLRRNQALFILWLFLPLALAIVFRFSLYDAWRHLFFIYPAFLIFSLTGITGLLGFLKKKLSPTSYAGSAFCLVLIIFLQIIWTATWMMKNHPYQSVYFNRLAGDNMQEIKQRFELDYWGLSYRKALEYILENDTGAVIKVVSPHLAGEDNALILPMPQRNRLQFTKTVSEAEYFISNYRWNRQGFPFKNEFFSIKVGNAKIMVVYKLR
jgi:hypothetical protein